MEATTAEQDLAMVSRFMELIATRQFEEARPMVHPDFSADEAGGLPYSGEYIGPDAFFDLVTVITDAMDLTPDHVQLLQVDKTIVGRFRLTFTRRDTGQKVSMSFVEIYQVRDGLIVHLDVYYKDPSAVAEMLAQ